jgi:hypothetical protein
MGWIKESGMSETRKAAAKWLGINVKISNHFMIRLHQRYTPQERAKVFGELYSLVKSDMYHNLFETEAVTLNVPLSGKHAVVLALKNKKLQLITIW